MLHPDRATTHRSLRVAGATASLLFGLIALLVAAPAPAEPRFEWSATLPFTGGMGQTHGDLVAHDGGVTALHSRPDLGDLRLFLSRWNADGAQVVARVVTGAGEIHYEPSLCWDGTRYAVATSSYTRGSFLLLGPTGDVLLPAVEPPSIPFGGRTAAFRVRCTPNGYAVFALLLEPEFPGSPYYYTRLHYWLLDAAGAASVDRDVGILLAPISYPGFEGQEKEYYDVAWAGAGFLVAYAAECGAPASFQACYRVINLAGDTVRAEAPVTTVPTQGPHLATTGAVIGVATLRQNPFPGGNTLFARFFDLDGTPRGPEQRYDDPALTPLGFAPTIVRSQAGFLAAYVQASPISLAYDVMLAPFDADGVRQGYGAPVADPFGLVFDTINLGIDFQLAAQGSLLFGKGQAGNIQVAPIVFRIPEPGALPLGIAALVALAPWGAARRRCPFSRAFAGRAVRRPRVTAAQRTRIDQALRRGPQAHGYRTELWTLPRIAAVTARETGVAYHPGHLWRVLESLGWSLQKPTTRARERDEEAIAAGSDSRPSARLPIVRARAERTPIRPSSPTPSARLTSSDSCAISIATFAASSCCSGMACTRIAARR